jgi:hypothetical protein
MLSILLLTGCTNKLNQNDDKERIYLSDEYYRKGEFIDLNSKDLLDKKNDTYVLFTYNSYCNLPVSCEEIFKDFAKKYKIDFISISYEEFKKTKFHDTVEYAPSVMIIEKDNIIGYLDANSDDDLNRYQDLNEFESWMDKYIYFNKK